MSDHEFELSVLASDKDFFEGSCSSLVVPTSQGVYGIMAHHANFIGAVVPGLLKLKTNVEGKEKVIYAAVSSGLVKVENNKVLVLVDSAEKPEEIDEIRAQRKIQEAQEAIIQKKSIQEYYEAQTRMARAVNRLKVKKRFS